MAKNARDLRPVPQYGWIVLAASLAVAACGDAAAQGNAGICTIAKTCSEAFFQCVYTRSGGSERRLHGVLQIAI